MFTYKKKYYLFVENTKDIDFRKLKLFNKYIIIYRNNSKLENFSILHNFRARCKRKKIQFFVSNNIKLMVSLRADGLYISAHNKQLNLSRLKQSNFKLIGSAHNFKELNLKVKQGCSNFIYSRLFETNYKFKNSHLGLIRFNLFKLSRNEDLVPLGGINITNLNKMRSTNSQSFAFLSEIKKKPAKIFSRLF